MMNEDEITIKANAEMMKIMFGNVKLNVGFSEMNNFAAQFADYIEMRFHSEYFGAKAIFEKDKDFADELLVMAKAYADALYVFGLYCYRHNFLMPTTQSVIDGRAEHMKELCDKARDGFYVEDVDFAKIPIIRVGTEDADKEDANED